MTSLREEIASARRIVVKLGTSSLVNAAGELDPAKIDRIVDAIEHRIARGSDVIVVSSGAIAAGMGPLGLKARPRDLATKQAAASVGQSVTFNWVLTARHATSTWEYFIGGRLLASFNDGGAQPGATKTHTVGMGGFSGRQTLLARWNIADTAMAFYSCVDLQIGGGGGNPPPTNPPPTNPPPTNPPPTNPPTSPHFSPPPRSLSMSLCARAARTPERSSWRCSSWKSAGGCCAMPVGGCR